MPFDSGIATGEDIKIFNYLVEPEQVSDLVHFAGAKGFFRFLNDFNPHPSWGGTLIGDDANDFNLLNFPFPKNTSFRLPSAFLFERFSYDNYKFAEEYSIKVYNFFKKYSFLELNRHLGLGSIGFASGETINDIDYSLLDPHRGIRRYEFWEETIDLSEVNKPFRLSFYVPEYNPNYIPLAGYLVVEDNLTYRPIITNYRDKFEYSRINNDCIKCHKTRKWVKSRFTNFANSQNFTLPRDILIASLVIDFIGDWTEEEKNVIKSQIPEYYFYDYLDTFFWEIDNIFLEIFPFLAEQKTVSTKIKYLRTNREFNYQNNYIYTPPEKIILRGSEKAIRQDEDGRLIETYEPACDLNLKYLPPESVNFSFYMTQGDLIRKYDDFVPIPFELNFAYLHFANNNSVGDWSFDYIVQDLGKPPIFCAPRKSVLGDFNFANFTEAENFIGITLLDASYTNNNQKIKENIPFFQIPEDSEIELQGLETFLFSKENDEIRLSYDKRFLGYKQAYIIDSYSSGVTMPTRKHETYNDWDSFRSGFNLQSEYSRYLYQSSQLYIGIYQSLTYSKIKRKQFTYDDWTNYSTEPQGVNFGTRDESMLVFSNIFSGIELNFNWENIDDSKHRDFVTNYKVIFEEEILGTHDLGLQPLQPFEILGGDCIRNYIYDPDIRDSIAIPFYIGYSNVKYTGVEWDIIQLPKPITIYSELDSAPIFTGVGTKYQDIVVDFKTTINNQRTETHTLRSSLPKGIEILDHQIFVAHIIKQHTECYEQMNCNCDEINEKLDKLIAALDANKFATLENNPQVQRTANLGYYIERIARILGISVNEDGSIRSIRQAQRITKGDTIPAGWNIGQWGRNQGGSQTGQTGGFETEDRDGLAYEIRSNTFGIDERTGEPNKIEEGGYALIENFPQLWEIILNDLDRAIGWQDAGANAIPSADGSTIATYQGINRMLLDILYNQSSISRSTTGAHISSLKNQAMLQETLAAFGFPATVKEIPARISEDVIAPIPVPGLAEGSPTLNDLLMLVLVNLSLLLGTKFKGVSPDENLEATS